MSSKEQELRTYLRQITGPAPRVEKLKVINSQYQTVDLEIAYEEVQGTASYILLESLLLVDANKSTHRNAEEEIAGRKICYIDANASILGRDQTTDIYNLLMYHKLETLDFQDMHVLDLGAADGICTLIALQRGARRYTAIDLDGTYEETLRKNLSLNARENTGEYIQADITDSNLYQRIDCQDLDAVFANLGKGQYSGIENTVAVALVRKLPNLRYFVGGGYNEIQEKHSPKEDIQALVDLGFKNKRTIEEDLGAFRLAFSMERKKRE